MSSPRLSFLLLHTAQAVEEYEIFLRNLCQMAATLTNYLLYGGYAAEGLGITIGNGLLLATIIMEQSLRKRKEMRIIATLCIADLVYGFFGFVMNVYRVLLMAIGLSLQPSTAWDCLKWPHSFLQQLGGELTAYMNLMVSIDRFIAVTFPVAYFKFGTHYSTYVIASFFIYFIASGSAMLGSTYLEAPYSTAVFNLLCLGAPYSAGYIIYHYTFIPVAGALQVIIYVGVFISYRSRRGKIQTEGNVSRATSQYDHQIKAQHRLTVTLGLITISTIFFFITPFSILAYIYFRSLTISMWANVALAMLCRVSAIANIIIYVHRQKEVRPGMWKILTCNAKKQNTWTTSVS